MDIKEHNKTVLMILGPTASGKTALSYSIACRISSEIINADVGQFYKPLSVGTAKPDLVNTPYAHHLFDVLDKPEDLTVSMYRELVIEHVNEIHKRNNQALIVGGSLFYIKSLFFPPVQTVEGRLKISKKIEKQLYNDHDSLQELWNKLFSIDPERAQAIHPHDGYRIKRALDIWYETGQKPSSFAPTFTSLPFDTHIMYLALPREIIRERINKRMHQMFDQGWIEEAERLIDTPWELFLKRKGLIGYPEIFAWIRAGKVADKKNALIEEIYYETVHYAKRQETFAKHMFALLSMNYNESSYRITTEFITQLDGF